MSDILNSPYDKNGFIKGDLPNGSGVKITTGKKVKPKDPAKLHAESKAVDVERVKKEAAHNKQIG